MIHGGGTGWARGVSIGTYLARIISRHRSEAWQGQLQLAAQLDACRAAPAQLNACHAVPARDPHSRAILRHHSYNHAHGQLQRPPVSGCAGAMMHLAPFRCELEQVELELRMGEELDAKRAEQADLQKLTTEQLLTLGSKQTELAQQIKALDQELNQARRKHTAFVSEATTKERHLRWLSKAAMVRAGGDRLLRIPPPLLLYMGPCPPLPRTVKLDSCFGATCCCVTSLPAYGITRDTQCCTYARARARPYLGARV